MSALNNFTLAENLTPTGAMLRYSNTVQAVGYYRGYGAIQTITCDVAGLVGDVRYQATISEDPATLAWFTLDDSFEHPHTVSGTVAAPLTGVDTYTVIGNFVWLRAVITDFTAGTINTIQVNY
jgi:hypothetical protein